MEVFAGNTFSVVHMEQVVGKVRAVDDDVLLYREDFLRACERKSVLQSLVRLWCLLVHYCYYYYSLGALI
jgi:hypothetical protein